VLIVEEVSNQQKLGWVVLRRRARSEVAVRVGQQEPWSQTWARRHKLRSTASVGGELPGDKSNPYLKVAKRAPKDKKSRCWTRLGWPFSRHWRFRLIFSD
jgi:hypothetical protein